MKVSFPLNIFNLYYIHVIIAPRGTKRPASTAFEFDHEHAEELARRAEAAALKQLELEQKEARKSKLPSAYWLASETPTAEGGDAALGKLKDMKVGTLCRASEFGHPLRYVVRNDAVRPQH
jgi:nitric oxide synthase-interacting protein